MNDYSGDKVPQIELEIVCVLYLTLGRGTNTNTDTVIVFSNTDLQRDCNVVMIRRGLF